MQLQIIDWNDKCIFNDYSVNGYSSDSDSDITEYIIQLFGKSNNHESVCINIIDVYPYFYIKTDELFDNIVTLLDLNEEHIYDTDYLKKKDYNGFQNEMPVTFIKVSFKSPIYLNKIKKIVETRYDVYEGNVNGIIQFIHDNHLTGCSWIEIPSKFLKSIVYDKLSKCDKEYTLSAHHIIKRIEKDDIGKLKILSYDIEVTSEDGSFPLAERNNDKIIQIGMTFNYIQEKECYKKYLINLGTCDEINGVTLIECKTEHELIEKYIYIIDKEDPDIICGYNIFGFDNKYMHDRAIRISDRKLSTMGRLKDIQKFEIKELSSSALGDNVLYYYRTPGRVMIDLMKVIRNSANLDKYSLDFVSSYYNQNDIIRLNHGSFITNDTNGLEINGYCFIKLIDTISNTEELYNQKIHITNIVDNEVFFDTNINIDSNSKLKWCMAKDDISASQIFKYFEIDDYHRSLVGKYCIKDCILVNQLMEKLDVISNSIAMANVCKVPLSYIFTRGQGIKAFSLIKYQANADNYLFPTIQKEKIINRKQQLSTEDVKKYKSILLPKCINEHCRTHKDIYLNAEMLKIEPSEYVSYLVCKQCEQVQYDTYFEGAHVKDPIPGYYIEPIIVMDFASLYPSSIIQKNLSGETQILDPKYDNLKNCEYYDTTYKTINGMKTCRFVKKNNKLGIIPKTLKYLLDERKAIKKRMKNTSDPFKKRILDGQQLAMKVTANSIYGQTGAITSPIYLKDIAACTTSTGKEMLLKAEKFMSEVFPEMLLDGSCKNHLDDSEIAFIENFILNYSISPIVVYGDTDSTFVSLNIRDKKTNKVLVNDLSRELSIKLGLIADKLASTYFPYPQYLEYEKVYHKWAIFCKKKYTGRLYETDPYKYKINNMGIVLKRRDNAKIVKKVCGTILHIMFNEDDYATKCALFIKELIQDIYNDKFDLSYYILTKTLKSSYKGKKKTHMKYKCNCNMSNHRKNCKSIAKQGDQGTWKWDDVVCSIAHVKLCQRMKDRDIGSAPNSNDRISYVHVKTKNKHCLQGDKIEEITYVKNKKLSVDYEHYINNQIKNPAIQFLELIIPDPEELFKLKKSKQQNIKMFL